MPVVRYSGEGGSHWNLESNRKFRWTQSCPRTGGALHAPQSIAANGTKGTKIFIRAFRTFFGRIIFIPVMEGFS